MTISGFDEAWVREHCRKHNLPLPKELAACDGKADKPIAARRKYGNVPVEDEGRKFDSKHEAEVYRRLVLETKGGEHCAVACQVPFHLPGGVKYVADFVTLDGDGSYKVWDAKSSATARDRVYRLKKRQMRECLGIEIQEV